MTAFNIVRFRVKPGQDQAFLDSHRNIAAEWPGIRRASIVKTGDRSYCLIAEWPDAGAIADARPYMIATLNRFRDSLEDLAEDLA